MSSVINQIKQALLILAGVCDGATKRDNVGFNGGDSNFGRSLARQIKEDMELSPKQLESACKMLQKYKLSQLKSIPVPTLADLKKEMENLNSNAIKLDDEFSPAEKIKKGLLIVFEKGFLPHDQMFGRSLVAQISSNKKLSEKQCELALRLLDRYEHLVTNLPTLDDIKKQFLLETNVVKSVSDIRKLGIVETGITISFSVYNSTFVNMIKNIYPTGEFVSQGNDKFWLFSFEALEKICKLFLPFGFEITDDLRDYISQIEFEKYEKDIENQERYDFVTEFIDRNKHNWSFTPFQHQLEAVQIFSKVKKGILADQQGLGKTKSALMLYKALQAYYWEKEYKELPIFVISPVSLKINWLNEAKSVDVKIEVFSSAKIPDPLQSEYLVIVDEAHYFQNLDAKRTKKYLEFVTDEHCTHLLQMTGTPMKNGRPINLYPLLKACDHPVSKNKKGYERFFCDARPTNFSKWDVTGSAHLKELSEEISDILLRRTKDQCLDLPEKIIQNVNCESTKERINEYNHNLSKLKKEYFERVSRGEISDNGRAIVFLGYLRMLASIYKTYQAIEMAKGLLEQNESVVIFTEFLESAEMIAREFDTIALTGSLKTEARQQLVDDFQAGKNKVFIGTIKAGGVGITLTHASYLIVIDLPWTPGDLEQAEDRIHRIGQNKTANIYRLFGQDICYIMAGVIGQKRENIDKVLKKYDIDVNKKDSPNFFKDLLEKLMNK